KKGRLEPRPARRRAAQMGRSRDRQLRQTGADPLYRRAAEDAQRQDHASAAEGNRNFGFRRRRCDDAGRPERRDPPGSTARRRIGGAGGFTAETLRRGENAEPRPRMSAAKWGRKLRAKTCLLQGRELLVPLSLLRSMFTRDADRRKDIALAKPQGR